METPKHHDPPAPLAACLIRRRAELRLSRPELARRVSVSHHYLWRLERGLNQPSAALATALAEALGLSIADLLGRDAPTGGATLWHPPAPRTDLAHRLRQLRGARGLTQEALAERAGLRRSVLTSIEQGIYRPSQRVARALTSALDLPVQELLGAVTLEHLRQPTSVPEGFSRRLRERRVALGLTVRTLAERAGLHHSYISHLERGVSHPSRAVVTALARALDLPVDALIGEGYQERSRPETGLPAVLRAQRETLELSQAVVARRAGISASHVKAIEAGRSRPTQEGIAQLARAVELSEEELLGDQDRAAFRARAQPAPGLGARLRQRRRALGLTAETLATRSGVTATSLSQIERGAWLPSRVVAQALATALDLRLEEMVDASTLTRLHEEREEPPGFARRLARLREARGLTQVALAGAAGLKAHYIAVLEKGQSQPSVEVARALAAALAVPLEELLGDVDPGDLHAWGPRYTALGARLRARRAALGFTQDALATRLGISRTALSRLEHDVVEPTTARLRALATALTTTPEALLAAPPKETGA